MEVDHHHHKEPLHHLLLEGSEQIEELDDLSHLVFITAIIFFQSPYQHSLHHFQPKLRNAPFRLDFSSHRLMQH
jgi:hypothetical protein